MQIHIFIRPIEDELLTGFVSLGNYVLKIMLRITIIINRP